MSPYTILAILPFAVFFLLLLWKKMPLIYVSLLTFILVLIISIFIWQVLPNYLTGSVVKGCLVAVDIFFIIFGAIFFLEIMKESKVIENIGFYLESISKDIRIQVIFLAWFFENFLEGTAGFGTPSTVVAPLLLGLGILPINAVIIALLGNSSSVVFGAAGTPIKVGFGDLASSSLPFLSSLINLVGILVPVFMLWFLSHNRENKKKFFFDALPFAIWAGIAFCVPSVLTVFLGQEFPSILGSVIGLILVFITTKLGLFVPKDVEYHTGPRIEKASMPIMKVILPYFLLIIFLVAGKFIIGSLGIPVPLIVKHTFAYFNPGFVFIIVGILSILIFGKKNVFVSSAKVAITRSIEPFLVIAFMSSIAQIMVNSIYNSVSIPSMIEFMAVSIKNSLLPLWAPLVGTFGSFLTGSATVSNIMFGNFLAATAKELGISVDKILALALVGGAAGNMIALADIMAAEAVVGLKNEEHKVLRGVIIPCAIYIILVGIIGLIITR